MGNMFAKFTPWFQGQIKQHGSELVVYSVGVDSVEVPAIVLEEFGEETENDNGGGIRAYRVDFGIDGVLLVLSSVLVVPRDGHRITRGNGSVFEVSARTGEPASVPLTPHGSMLRIHTARVSA